MVSDASSGLITRIQPTTVCIARFSESESLLPLLVLNQTADRLATSDPDGNRMMMPSKFKVSYCRLYYFALLNLLWSLLRMSVHKLII